MTGSPGTPISLSELLSTGTSPNDPNTSGSPNGFEIRAFFGNTGDFLGQNKQINFGLQRVFSPVTVGRTYVFSGDVLMGEGFLRRPGMNS